MPKDIARRLGLLASAVVGLSASAAPRLSLVTVPTDRDASREALQLHSAVAERLAAQPDLVLVDAASGVARDAAGRSARDLASADKAVADVEALLASVEYEKARTRAEDALRELKSADFRAVRARYLQLLVLLARITLALKAGDRGEGPLREALALDEQLASPRGLNKEEARLFAAVRDQLSSMPAAPSTRVDSDAPGRVWLDGQPLGVTPVSIGRVRGRRHFLTLEVPGCAPLHREVTLGGGVLELSASCPAEAQSVREAAAAVVEAWGTSASADAAAVLLARSGMDEVIVVAFPSAGPARVLRVRSSGDPLEQIAEGRDAATVADAIRAARGPKAPAAVVEARPVTAPVDEQRPVRPTVRLWAFSAAGAALLATGVGLVTYGRVLGAPYERVDQLEYARVGLDAQTAANGFIAGGIAVVLTAVVVVGFGVLLHLLR